MRTEIAWAELHAPLFLAGTNLQQKLDPKKRTGLVMEYDEVKRHLYVSYNEQTARIPETSVLSMVEKTTAKLFQSLANANVKIDANGHIVPVDPAKPTEIISTHPSAFAQVSTPTSHVFAGPGAGSTGQEPPKAKAKGKAK